ncbi:MAG: hypothetical protein ACR2MS_12110, partial [Weeksellaceae bacterium]
MKRIFKIVIWIIAFILLILIGIGIAIQTPYVQTKIVHKVLKSLNEQFGTSLEVGKVDVDFWGDVILYDVSAKDHHDLKFIKIPKLTADVNLWDIYQNSNNIHLDAIAIENADAEIITYVGEDSSNFIQFIDKFVASDEDSESTFKLNGNLSIESSNISIINRNLEKNQQVWLDSKNFNTTIKRIDLEGSTYVAEIRTLNFDAQKNGETYRLNNLKAHFKMTDQSISLDDFIIDTQSSYLSGDIRLKYDSIAQFDDFGNKVNWDILLEEDNQFGYKDLRYFVPSWEKDIVLDIEGSAKGTLNDLNLRNFTVANGETRLATESIDLGELYNGNFIINTPYIDATTSYAELIRILPTDITKDITNFINRLGTVDYKGSLEMDDINLNARGKALTALGDADFNLLLNNYSGNNARYSGSVQTTSFDLQKLTDTQELGKVSGNLTFDGSGYAIENIIIKTQGKLNYLDINGDRYQNLKVDGTLNHQVFNGILEVNDPNAQLTYKGVLDFSSKHLKLNFESKVQYINLTYFGVTNKKNTWLQADVHADTQFSNINDLEGHIALTDIVFNTDTINLSLPVATINIKAGSNNTQKELLLDIPEYLNATILGTFQVDELADVLQNGFGNFLVDYERKKVSPNQFFDFNIELKDNLVSYFVPDLYLQPTTTIYGTTNDREHLFEFEMYSPFVQFQDYKADSLQVNASTVNNQKFNIAAKEISIQDNIIKQFKVDGQKLNDSIVANAHFYAGEDGYGEFDLNFYQRFSEDLKGVKTGFAPSTIKLDDQVWHINPLNETDTNYAVLNFDKSLFKVNNILLQSDDQLLRVNGNYVDKNNYELDADLENLDLAKLLPSLLHSDFEIAGIANGNLDIIKANNTLKPVADLRIDSIVLNNYYIGNFVTTASYDVEQSIFDIEGSLDRDNVNTLFLTGSIDNKGEDPELDMVASLDDFNISVLGVFLEDVLNEWSGTLSGDVALKGNPSDPEIQG